jgi:hypothetical protein
MQKDINFYQFCDYLIEDKLKKRLVELILKNKSYEEITEILIKEYRERRGENKC